MVTPPSRDNGRDQKRQAFYRSVLSALADGSLPYLVGGAFALERYTGIGRQTKDLDLFVRPEDCDRTLAHLCAAGHQAKVVFPHWLAKTYAGDDVVDLIFSSGNGIAGVDDVWFEHAVEGEVLGISVKLCPPEETIWSKAFIMERERYDGADVAHLLHGWADRLDWNRVLQRFGEAWPVLLSHLILFGFIYPSERGRIPSSVMKELLGRARRDVDDGAPGEPVCQGTLLSRAQYLVDIEEWGYGDARLRHGTMTPRQVARWTAAIEPGQEPHAAGGGR